MTPEQHREQAEVLLAEARSTASISGDPKSPSYEKRMRFAELATQRAIAHALLGGQVPAVVNAQVDRVPTAVELADRYAEAAAERAELDGGQP